MDKERKESLLKELIHEYALIVMDYGNETNGPKGIRLLSKIHTQRDKIIKAAMK